jgi:hypothetical protein
MARWFKNPFTNQRLKKMLCIRSMILLNDGMINTPKSVNPGALTGRT